MRIKEVESLPAASVTSESSTIMKSIFALLCLFAVALAAPQFDERPFVTILRDDRVDNGDGNFNYAFAADNGLEMEVAGTPEAEGAVAMRGFYVLPLPDGSFARIEFVADANGFRPLSDILPTPHPLPAHAQEQIRIAEEQRAAGIQFE